MNVLIDRLAEICRENPLTEKWLVVPSLRIGQQWLDRVARSGQPVVNVRLTTAMRLAYDSIESDSDFEPGKVVDSLGGAAIVQHLWASIPKEEFRELHSLSPTYPLFEKLFETIETLRLSDLTINDLHNDQFENPGKGNDIRLLFSQYEKYLQQKNLWDRTKILKKAIAAAEQNRQDSFFQSLFLIPAELELSRLEKHLIQRLVGDRWITLPSTSIIAQSHQPSTDLDLLRWIQSPADAPLPLHDGSVSLFSAIGEINEIREVFRRCMNHQIPLDTVELLYTDAETYLPQIYETGLSIFAVDSTQKLPFTFTDGIPIRYSRPGRLLLCGLEWIRSDYSQVLLIRMLEDGLLDHSRFETNPLCVDSLIQTLRSMAIGSGRERYAIKIRQEIAARKKRIQDNFSLYELQENEESEFCTQLQHEIEILETLLVVIGDWLSALPDRDTKPVGQIDAFLNLVSEYSACSTELDHNACQRLIEELQSMRKWIQDSGERIEINILDWLSTLPSQLRVLGSAPRPGCLHVSGIHSGGHSGRANTFIAGLDDGRFPGSSLQDPFLLDRERETISPDLPTALSRLHHNFERFYQLLGRIEGNLVLSYSCHDLMDDREQFLSSAILAIYRIVSGNREGTPSSLADWLFPPVSFSPMEIGNAFNESELWMSRIAGQACGYNASADIERRYPHIQRGLQARRARWSDEYTRYDGWVPESGKDLDPTLPHGIVMSASRFETLGQCPLRFFFEHGLKLEPPEEIGVDPDCWLDPRQFGSLMHEIFELFIQELIDRKQKPHYKNHWPRLNQILDDLVAIYREYIPPPNQNVYTRQYRELQQCAHIFLRDEERHCQIHTPVYVEAAVGIPSRGSFDSASAVPLKIPLPDGNVFRARGIIDRVDRIGEEKEQLFAVWDYKSGSTYKYDRNDPFQQGRIIQHSLYYELMTRWLKSQVSPKATLHRFGYFFPSEKGKGERIAWTEPELAHRANLFQSLCQIIAHGVFAPTNDKKDCNFCDYQPICQDIDFVTQSSDEKLRNPMNVRLQPLKELRCDEE